MFSYAAGKVVESFYRFNLTENDKVIYQAHEWMTGMGALYLQKAVPEIATIFTTHATSIGRSIAGNNKPLYDYLFAYNGDQMARELNMEAKHSIEKQTAHHVDCFTTVSEITNNECKELLDKPSNLLAKFNIAARAFLRLAVNVRPCGTKSSSNPFINTTSPGISFIWKVSKCPLSLGPF